MSGEDKVGPRYIKLVIERIQITVWIHDRHYRTIFFSFTMETTHVGEMGLWGRTAMPWWRSALSKCFWFLSSLLLFSFSWTNNYIVKMLYQQCDVIQLTGGINISIDDKELKINWCQINIRFLMTRPCHLCETHTKIWNGTGCSCGNIFCVQKNATLQI